LSSTTFPSYFADKLTGPFNLLIPFCAVSALALFFWPLVRSGEALYAWAVVYGFFVAGFQGMFPAVLTSLTKDMSKVGTRNGMGFAVMGVASLVGPPIAGALVQSHGGSYVPAQVFGGAVVLAGTGVLVLARVAITGWKLRVRV
jgi:MFS family permease